jgi:methionyl-tRNA synthetase
METSETKKDIAPLKQEISYEQFAAMDLRVGKVLAAEIVPKTDKLIHLTVDLGFEIRSIVSGIAKYFKAEELPGRQVVVLANLAPRKMRGIESAGMILLAEDGDGKLIFVAPDQSTNPGSVIA